MSRYFLSGHQIWDFISQPYLTLCDSDYNLTLISVSLKYCLIGPEAKNITNTLSGLPRQAQEQQSLLKKGYVNPVGQSVCCGNQTGQIGPIMFWVLVLTGLLRKLTEQQLCSSSPQSYFPTANTRINLVRWSDRSGFEDRDSNLSMWTVHP